MEEMLNIDCGEWHEVAEDYPVEMEVIREMMIEAEWEVCA